MRNGLSVSDLGDFLQQPILATLATHRKDASVMLSPVWYEWQDGFVVIIGATGGKASHLRADPRATIVVAEGEPPYRGVEVSGTPEISVDPELALETVRRIAVRYLGPERGLRYVGDSGEGMAVLRLKPGRLRVWDFADEYRD